MPKTVFLLTALLPVCLAAQQPQAVPEAQPVQAPLATSGSSTPQTPSFRERVKQVRAEYEALQQQNLFPEAYNKLAAALGSGPEPWDKATIPTLCDSYARYREAIGVYMKASELAVSAGLWERALEHAEKVVLLAQENCEKAKAEFVQASETLKRLAADQRVMAKEDETYVNELKAKPNPDDGDKQQLAFAAQREAAILNNENWSLKLLQYISIAEQEAGMYQAVPESIKASIKAETEDIARAVYKNSKITYVAGAAGGLKVFLGQCPDDKSRLERLYRMQYLDPANKKIQAAISKLLGRPSAAPDNAPKAVQKKNKR